MVPAASLAAQRSAGKGSSADTSRLGGTESPGTESVPTLAMVDDTGLPMVASSPLQAAMLVTARATMVRPTARRRSMKRSLPMGSGTALVQWRGYGASVSNNANTLAVPTPTRCPVREMKPSCTPVVGSSAAKNCSWPSPSTATSVSSGAPASLRHARA